MQMKCSQQQEPCLKCCPLCQCGEDYGENKVNLLLDFKSDVRRNLLGKGSIDIERCYAVPLLAVLRTAYSAQTF